MQDGIKYNYARQIKYNTKYATEDTCTLNNQDIQLLGK